MSLVSPLLNAFALQVIVTNTIPTHPDRLFPELTVLSVANLLGETIWRVYNSSSVQSLLWDLENDWSMQVIDLRKSLFLMSLCHAPICSPGLLFLEDQLHEQEFIFFLTVMCVSWLLMKTCIASLMKVCSVQLALPLQQTYTTGNLSDPWRWLVIVNLLNEVHVTA